MPQKKKKKKKKSATKDNDVVKHGSGLAIDMDLETKSIAVAGSDGKIWIKINLDQVHCIQQVIRKYHSYTYTWTCTKENCDICESTVNFCNFFTLTVNTEATATSNLPSVSDCKYGDTVKLEIDSEKYNDLNVNEIWIIGKRVQGYLTSEFRSS